MENINEERVCFCALNKIFGFEPKTGAALVETFGGAVEGGSHVRPYRPFEDVHQDPVVQSLHAY